MTRPTRALVFRESLEPLEVVGIVPALASLVQPVRLA
jgi:hypothetical protein